MMSSEDSGGPPALLRLKEEAAAQAAARGQDPAAAAAAAERSETARLRALAASLMCDDSSCDSEVPDGEPQEQAAAASPGPPPLVPCSPRSPFVLPPPLQPLNGGLWRPPVSASGGSPGGRPAKQVQFAELAVGGASCSAVNPRSTRSRLKTRAPAAGSGGGGEFDSSSNSSSSSSSSSVTATARVTRSASQPATKASQGTSDAACTPASCPRPRGKTAGQRLPTPPECGCLDVSILEVAHGRETLRIGAFDDCPAFLKIVAHGAAIERTRVPTLRESSGLETPAAASVHRASQQRATPGSTAVRRGRRLTFDADSGVPAAAAAAAAAAEDEGDSEDQEDERAAKPRRQPWAYERHGYHSLPIAAKASQYPDFAEWRRKLCAGVDPQAQLGIKQMELMARMMRLAIQAPEGRFTAYAVLGGACAPPGCTPDSPEYWSLAAILCSIARASGSNVNALLLPAWEPATSVALLSRFGLLFRKLTDALTRAARAGLSQHGGCTGLLVASVTLVCAPTSHLKDSEWTKEEQKQLMAAREAYRRHIYLDVSGTKAQLAVTEAVRCAVPPHPDKALPLNELKRRAEGNWRPPNA